MVAKFWKVKPHKLTTISKDAWQSLQQAKIWSIMIRKWMKTFKSTSMPLYNILVALHALI